MSVLVHFSLNERGVASVPLSLSKEGVACLHASPIEGGMASVSWLH